MPRVLRALGFYPHAAIEAVAQSMYSDNFYRDPVSEVRLYAVGDEVDQGLERRRRRVRQLTWREILGFIHGRFTDYPAVKADHQQWGDIGRRLYDLALATEDRDQFIALSRSMLCDERGRRLPPSYATGV